MAWIVVEPAATPVIGTTTLVVFAGMVTVDGTVATAGLSELRFTVTPPAGAGPERLRVTLACAVVVPVTLGCANVSVAMTCTITTLLEDNVAPEAVTVADPTLTPQTSGVLWFGVVAPAGMNKVIVGLTIPGPRATVVGSLVVSVRNAPFDPAAVPKLTGNGTQRPGLTLKLVKDTAGVVPGTGLYWTW